MEEPVIEYKDLLDVLKECDRTKTAPRLTTYFDTGYARYLITNLAAWNPVGFLEAFFFEQSIRDKWWKVQKGDVAFDIGAGFGPYTLQALAMGASYVISFEPAHAEFFDIAQQLAANGWTQKCLLLGFMAGSRPGAAPYYSESHSSREDGRKEHRHMVPVDQIVRNRGLKRVDWIKIDVEGAEPDVLKGCTNTLTDFSPGIIVENHVGFNPTAEQDVVDILSPIGYVQVDSLKGIANSNENWSLWRRPG